MTFKTLTILAVGLCLLTFVRPTEGSGCYSYSSYKSYSYPSYSYSPTYYREIPYYKEYPIARYVDVYPIYGQLYFGPGSTASYAKTVSAVNAALAATAAVTAASAAPAPVATTITSTSSTTVTSQDIARVVGVLEGIGKRLDGVTGRLDQMEMRLRAVEVKMGNATPAPPSPGTGPAIASPAAVEVSAIDNYNTFCALCHKQGNELKSRSSDHPKGLAFLGKDGKYMGITAEVAVAMNRVLKDGSMPPKPIVKEGKPSHDIKPPTDREAFSMLMAVEKFPIVKSQPKKEEE